MGGRTVSYIQQGGKGNCDRESVVYKGTCLTCRDHRDHVYIGETSRSGYVSGKQHLEAIREYHRNGTRFKMDIVKYLRPRQI